jgi:hypothetical protein
VSKRNTLIWDQRDKLIYCRIAKVFTFIFHSCLARKLPPTERRKRGGGEVVGERREKGVGFSQQECGERCQVQPAVRPAAKN